MHYLSVLLLAFLQGSEPVQLPTSAKVVSSTVAPTTTVTWEDDAVTFVVSHPDGLRQIDWRTLQVVDQGQDLTDWFRTSLRSEYTTVSINREFTRLTVSSVWAPAGPAIGRGPCRVGVPCRPVEVLLRDASGYPDPQYTDQQPLLPVWDSLSQWQVSGVPFTPIQPRTITRFEGVVNDEFDGSMNGDWGNFTWHIDVFAADTQFPTAKEAFDADALHGNLINSMPLSVSHTPFGLAFDDYVTLIPTAHISLAAGTEYWISVKARQIGGTAASSPSFRHTIHGGLVTDYGIADNLVPLQSVPYTNFGLTPGALALDIYGY